MPPLTETITFTSGPAQLAAYAARPEGPGPFPALVVIHEAYGLNDDIRGIARRLAEAGYAALAVDLFAGRNRAVCMFRFFGGMLFNSLGHGALADLRAALDTLAAQPYVDAGRLGAVGFCMGGNFAICLACTDQRLKVIAPFYAANPRPLEAVQRLCPVVGSYPDPDFSTAAGRQLQAALEEYRIEHDIKIYPGAAHSFANGRPGEANAAAAQDAWARMLTFLGRHLSDDSAN
ncbi:MAG: dienelactone hydrolase family protein [Anaerolineales bacterium]|nr:dienelactone hydrolase family protein [Anaerolineales bacterium]